jgi:hypothetical protein
MTKFLRLASLICLFSFSASRIMAQMRITEFMYDGANMEFIEFTNVGAAPINMTGWSFDDDSRAAGTVSLSVFGTVQPGESVILSEASTTAFRTAWGLCNNVKVIGGLVTNLGRADEINLFDNSNALVDRLTYGDQTFPGTIRTQNKSGWVNAAGLGTNTIANWTLAATADAEGSFASTSGDTGSPGKSTRATVSYNACLPGTMRITEYMYDGANMEFIEFTNVGTTTVDMTNWSFDDDSRAAGTVSLGAFGTVQPGESVILAENNAATFRTVWSLCTGIKIIGGLSTNLGRADEINLFNSSGTLVDRLTYGDQAFPGTIRTQNKSGWVNAAGLGANTIANWTLAALADIEGSFASTGGDIGSPGKSTRAMLTYDPCSVVVGAPTIVIDVANTSNLLDGGVALSPVSPYAISGVTGDATDPAVSTGIQFTIGDDATPVDNLVVTVSSSNAAVVPNANLVVTGTGASRNLKITPAGTGYANITVTVTDGTNNTTYVIAYAASGGTLAGSQWLTGIADASAAIALDNDHMVIANDETNLFYLYNRNTSGLPVKTFDFNNNNLLNLTDGSTGNWKELDLEAVAPSPTVPGRTYWLGSMSNSSSFNDKPNRDRIMGIDMTGAGAAANFANAGFISGLRSRLIAWGDANGYNFSAAAAEGKDPKTIDGFNAEGLVFGPDNTTVYIGFRAPLVPTGTRTKAVIAPLMQFETWFSSNGSGNLSIGTPIELDLGGRGIRDMIRLSNGNYVIVAGSYDETPIPAVYRWTGNPADAPIALNSFDLTGLNAEAVMPLNQGGLLSLNKLQVISDNGDNIFYNDGIAAKDLTQNNYKKFSSVVLTSAFDVLPIRFDYFTAQRKGIDIQLDWKDGTPGDAASFEIMRSGDGAAFTRIKTITPTRNQTIYAFTDIDAPAGQLYYRINAKDASGKSFLSVIRPVEKRGATIPLIKLYPNPVREGIFSIQINKAGLKRMAIYNNAGILFKQTSFTEGTKDFSTVGWPKGQYVLRILSADGIAVTEKLVVQ